MYLGFDISIVMNIFTINCYCQASTVLMNDLPVILACAVCDSGSP